MFLNISFGTLPASWFISLAEKYRNRREGGYTVVSSTIPLQVFRSRNKAAAYLYSKLVGGSFEDRLKCEAPNAFPEYSLDRNGACVLPK